jgi:uncharacterized protein
MRTNVSPEPFAYVSDLHLFAYRTGSLAFHPESFSLFRIGATFAAMLREIRRGADLARVAELHGIRRADLESKLIEMGERINREPHATAPSGVYDSPEREIGLTLHVSNACNLGCLYCYAQGGDYGRKPQRRMDRAVALKAVDTMYRNFPNIRNLMFFGGEPLLALDVIEEVCRDLHARCQRGEIARVPQLKMVTNGTRINDKAIQVIRQYGIQVTISVDGPKAINDRLRPYKSGRGSYDVIKRGFDRIVSEIGQIPLIEATYTQVHRKEGMSVADLVDFLEREFLFTVGTVAGVDVPEDHPLALKTEETKHQLQDALHRQVMAMARGELPKIERSFLYPILLFVQRKGSRFTCSVGHDGFSITTEGEIYPCQVFVGRPEFLLGTVDDFDYFNPSPRLRAALDRLIYADKERSPRCRACWAKAFCTNCPGATAFANNGYQVPASYCRNMREWLETVLVLLYQIRSDPALWPAFLEGLKLISHEIEENEPAKWAC